MDVCICSAELQLLSFKKHKQSDVSVAISICAHRLSMNLSMLIFDKIVPTTHVFLL